MNRTRIRRVFDNRVKSAAKFKLATLLTAVFILLTGIATPSAAQDETPDAPPPVDLVENERELDKSLVIIDGNELFETLGLTAFPAEERALSIVTNILKAADLSQNSSVKMETRPGEFGPTIFAEGIEITVISEVDAEYESVKPELLASLQSTAIEEAILAYRLERSESGRLESAIRVLIFTVLFLIFSALLVWTRKRLVVWVKNKIAEKLKNVETATNEIVRSHTIATLAGSLVRFVSVTIFIVALYYYLSMVLNSFAETRVFGDDLLKFLTEPIYAIFLTIISQIPNLVALIVIGLITRFVIKTVRLVFDKFDSGAFSFEGFESQWIWPTYNIVRVLILLLALIFAFPYIPGSSSDAFKGVSILIGVMMSFGSSSVVGNLLAGVFVIYKRSTNIGDRIRVGEHTGDVVAIKLMETHLKSLKNELISIPNSLLLSTDVVNYSTKLDDKGLLVHTTVGIGYEEPQEKIVAMLISAANRTKLLKKNPKPFVLRTTLADFSVHYQINAYSNHGDKLPAILSDLHANILDVFNENKVQIMTPSYIADTPEPKIAPAPKVS